MLPISNMFGNKGFRGMTAKLETGVAQARANYAQQTCSSISFFPPGLQVKRYPPIPFQHDEIPNVMEYKYQGVTFNRKLDYQATAQVS